MKIFLSISKLTGLLITGLGVLLGWAFWFPIREWCFAQIPVSAQWAGIAKIVIVICIGYFGGVVLPIIVIGTGIYVLFAD